jgi:hypothetical protein
MTYINLYAKCAEARGFQLSAIRIKAERSCGFMPTHVFLRLFLSAFAAILAVHFWKHGAR